MSAAYSDGYFNLAGAMLCAHQLQIPEVTLFNANKLFRANRTTKSSSWELSAFDSALMRPLAEFGIVLSYDHKSIRNFSEPNYGKTDFAVVEITAQIGVVHFVPGMGPTTISPFQGY